MYTLLIGCSLYLICLSLLWSQIRKNEDWSVRHDDCSITVVLWMFDRAMAMMVLMGPAMGSSASVYIHPPDPAVPNLNPTLCMWTMHHGLFAYRSRTSPLLTDTSSVAAGIAVGIAVCGRRRTRHPATKSLYILVFIYMQLKYLTGILL